MNTPLWNNILQFDFDTPRSEYGFSIRLANENFWTKEFTESAILEYKKFMYLAATSDMMVSPSEIIDVVWHQHLIFTQSYQDFCNLIGKQVQHVPSTHNRDEAERFRQAKERTKKLYAENFGKWPSVIWEYSGMYESLRLKKARFKLRSVIIVGIFIFIAAIAPAYWLLRPLYVKIGNPEFIIGFLILAGLTFAALEIYNRAQLRQMVDGFDSDSFIFKLHPFEVIYLQTQKLSKVIAGVVNELIKQEKIFVHRDYKLESSSNALPSPPEEYQTMEALQNSGKIYYPELLRKILTKPLFWNTANCMDAFKKYVIKSRKFARLFYLNFGVLSILIMIAFVRFCTGFLRDRPVGYLTMTLVLLTAIIIAYLINLTKRMCTDVIPELYKKKVLSGGEVQIDWQWSYFIMGSAVLVSSFTPLERYVDKNNAGSSSCGTSCGSSCGSSCSSCGGCGGGD